MKNPKRERERKKNKTSCELRFGDVGYLHLTLGRVDDQGIQNPKQNNEATVWRPGSRTQASGLTPPWFLPAPPVLYGAITSTSVYLVVEGCVCV